MRRPARRWRRRRGARDPGRAERRSRRDARIAVECPDLCPRFTARVFEEVTIGPSPLWLAARLLAAGHAADLQRRRHHQLRDAPDRAAAARLRPRPGRRRPADGAPARAGETVEALDGATRTLDDGMVVICDADGPTSIAGIMGGARSEVGDGTTAHAARGGDLGRRERPAHRARARAAQRGLGALREGALARPAARGAGASPSALLDRAVRRAPAARHDRRRRPGPGAAAAGAAPGACRRAARRARSRRERCAQILEALGFDVGAAGDELERRPCRTSAAAT